MAKKAKSVSKKTTKTQTETKVVSAKSSTKAMATISTSIQVLREMSLVGIVISEFVGTFILVAVLLYTGFSPLYGAIALVGIILATSRLTSAHLNPAMTIGAFVNRKIDAVYAVGHILSQFLGGIVAFFALDAFSKGSLASGAVATTNNLAHAAIMPAGKEWYIFAAELIGALILSFGFAAALNAKKDKVNAALSYGFVYIAAAVVAMQASSSFIDSTKNTGYAVLSFINPAAAAAANGLSWSVWPIAIYVVAPAVAAIIGIAVYDFVQSQPSEE
ncbi:hypothetical protein HGB24_01605 [Candidatus Saccharibacteria bacterium]|nr:hypothetical protein [Candidatus Saccharibacteria bacterium]